MYLYIVQNVCTDGKSIPEEMSEEPGQGRLKETVEDAWIFKKENQAATDITG